MKSKVITMLIISAISLALCMILFRDKGDGSVEQFSTADIDVLADNLTYFNYSGDRQDRLDRIEHLISQDARMEINSFAHKFDQDVEYIGTDVNLKIINKKSYFDESNNTICIYVTYTARPIFKDKMVTIIYGEYLEDGIINHLEVYDLFSTIAGAYGEI